MNILITGSNRGIGLELVRQYAEAEWQVIATCRHPEQAQALIEIAERRKNVTIERLDITNPEDIRAIQWGLDGRPIDILCNNAGIYLEQSYDAPMLGRLRYGDWLRTLEVNTLGAVRLTEALVDEVAAGEKRLVAVMSSHMGSIEDIDFPGSYYYRSSKAALNAAMRGLAEELRPRGIGVLLLHPGGVRTRMGPRDGISSEESVRGMRRLIDQFRIEDSGRFWGYDGMERHW